MHACTRQRIFVEGIHFFSICFMYFSMYFFTFIFCNFVIIFTLLKILMLKLYYLGQLFCDFFYCWHCFNCTNGLLQPDGCTLSVLLTFSYVEEK